MNENHKETCQRYFMVEIVRHNHGLLIALNTKGELSHHCKTVKQAKKILLIEENEVISEDHRVVEIFSKYFSQVTDSLDIREYIPPNKDLIQIKDPVLRAIEKFKNTPVLKEFWHPQGIKERVSASKTFTPGK